MSCNCAICLEDKKIDTKLSCFTCKNSICTDCFKNLKKINRRALKCPFCRATGLDYVGFLPKKKSKFQKYQKKIRYLLKEWSKNNGLKNKIEKFEKLNYKNIIATIYFIMIRKKGKDDMFWNGGYLISNVPRFITGFWEDLLSIESFKNTELLLNNMLRIDENENNSLYKIKTAYNNALILDEIIGNCFEKIMATFQDFERVGINKLLDFNNMPDDFNFNLELQNIVSSTVSTYSKNFF